jgi:hypothetical protein
MLTFCSLRIAALSATMPSIVQRVAHFVVMACFSVSGCTIPTVSSFVLVMSTADFGWDVGWDAHCSGLTATIRREKHWEAESEQWESSRPDEVIGWGVPIDNLTWKASNEKLFNTFYAMSWGWPNRVWPKVDEGIDVSVEVKSNVEELVVLCAACRYCHIRTDVSTNQSIIMQLRRYFMEKLCMILFRSQT